MVPRWTLAAAFAAGLVPGLLLYWTGRTPPAAPVLPTVSNSAVTPSPTAPNPVTGTAAKAPERRANTVLPAAGNLEPSTNLQAVHQETLARLSAAEKAAGEWQAKLQELEPRLSALTEQHQASLAHEKELRQQLEAAQRQLAMAEAAAKTRETRLADLESAQQTAQRKSAEAGQRLQRAAELAAELEENTRRRESYLNAILGRYREATDLFRAMSLRLDNPRDVATPLNNDLSRIQSAIQSAEEDLRQLRTLNAQSAKLQKEISARK